MGNYYGIGAEIKEHIQRFLDLWSPLYHIVIYGRKLGYLRRNRRFYINEGIKAIKYLPTLASYRAYLDYLIRNR